MRMTPDSRGWWVFAGGVVCKAENKYRVGMQLRSGDPRPWECEPGSLAVRKMPLAAVGRVIR